MPEAFDPYYKWLGIPPREQPPNHYRLLGVELLESDAEVIGHAADQRIAFLRNFQSGPNGDAVARLLNQITAARLCLLDPEKKADYDRSLPRGGATKSEAGGATVNSKENTPRSPLDSPVGAQPAAAGRAAKSLAGVAVGIDLGTSSSLLAYVGADGRPVPLCGADGRPVDIPTAVFFGDELLVGEAATEMGASMPALYAEGFKREMGKPHFHREIRQRGVPPEVLCGFVLRWLKRTAEASLGKVDKAVIAVPAYYNETRRKSTQEAGRLAGLDVIEIINEPTAAAVAVAYLSRLEGGTPPARETIMVYDFGGGTFDASILRVEGRKFSTLATDGDIQLGGYDFDERLANYLADRFQERHGIDPRSDAASMHRLWQVARETKHQLTDQDKAAAVCNHAGLRMGVEVTREVFDELIEPLVERTLNTCVDVLQEAKLNWGDIDRILLVGGSSQVPLVARRLEQLSGKKPIMPSSPLLLVAQGAALHAAFRSDKERLAEEAAFDIVNVNAHSLGIESIEVGSMEPINTILIPRNTPLPTSVVRKFITRRENQQSVVAKVLEGESENPRFCTPIGKCTVRLDSGLPAGTDVEVSCHYRADGLVYVAARIPATKTSAQVELRRERSDELESLTVWQRRLTVGDEPEADETSNVMIPEPADEPLDGQATPEHLIKRLDFLYTQVGKRAASAALPAHVLPVQRALHAALREASSLQQILDRLQAQYARGDSQQGKRELVMVISRARAQFSQTVAFAAHSYIALGRECLAAGTVPSGSEAVREEADRIDDQLKLL